VDNKKGDFETLTQVQNFDDQAVHVTLRVGEATPIAPMPT